MGTEGVLLKRGAHYTNSSAGRRSRSLPPPPPPPRGVAACLRLQPYHCQPPLYSWCRAGDYVASWRTRYFLLQECGGPAPQLAYFREARRGAGPPAGVLHLSGAHVTSDPAHPIAFDVVDAAGRAYHLRAASASQAQHWVDRIGLAIRQAAAVAAAAAAASSGRQQAAASPATARRGLAAAAAGGFSPFHARRGSAGSDAPLPSPGSSSGAGTPASVAKQRPWTAALFSHSQSATSSSEAEARAAAAGRRTSSGDSFLLQQQAAAAAAAGAAGDASYSASLPSLQGPRGGGPIQAMMAGLGASLPQESVDEQYQRALLFMERHAAELSPEQAAVLEVGGRRGAVGWGGSPPCVPSPPCSCAADADAAAAAAVC